MSDDIEDNFDLAKAQTDYWEMAGLLFFFPLIIFFDSWFVTFALEKPSAGTIVGLVANFSICSCQIYGLCKDGTIESGIAQTITGPKRFLTILLLISFISGRMLFGCFVNLVLYGLLVVGFGEPVPSPP